MYKQVFVTGASGFIGKALINRFVQNNIPVQGFTRKVIPGLTTIGSYGDIPYANDTVLVHLAQSNQLYVSSEGEEIVLCRTLASKNWKHFIYASSAVVYGDDKIYPRKTEETVKASNAYTHIKLSCEKITGKVNGTSFRFSNVYGPEITPDTVISDIFSQLNKKEALVMRNTSPVRDFIWVNDVTDCLVSAVKKPREGIYNLGSGTGISIGELAATTLTLAGQKGRKCISQSISDKSSSLILDITETQSVFEWSPKMSIEEGLSYLLKMKINND